MILTAVLYGGMAFLLLTLAIAGFVACGRTTQEDPTPLTDTTPDAQPTPSAVATEAPSLAISNRIAYVGTGFEIRTINPDGTGDRLITDQEGLYTWPAWSPLGDMLAFSSFSEDPMGPGKALYSVAAQGPEANLLFENAPNTGPQLARRYLTT